MLKRRCLLIPTEPLLIMSVILSAVVVVLCLVILYRSGRTPSVLSPALDQRLLGIEGTIGATLRDEFGRDRDETREASRSLREELIGLFERLAGSLRASLADLSTGQQAQLEGFAVRLNEANTRAASNFPARSLPAIAKTPDRGENEITSFTAG